MKDADDEDGYTEAKDLAYHTCAGEKLCKVDIPVILVFMGGFVK